MRGKKAKAIRKQVYRDVPKDQRRHKLHNSQYVLNPTSSIYPWWGTLLCTGERRAYQDAKRTIKSLKVQGKPNNNNVIQQV